MPDFDRADAEPTLRQALRERLDELLDAPLRTRQVLMDLQRY
jgi:DNA repair protein RecO (recombination protein O)